MGSTPVIGDIYDVTTAVIGKDIITGEKLTLKERLVNAAGVLIPGVSGGQLKAAVKYSDDILNVAVKYGDEILEATRKHLDESSNIVRKLGGINLQLFGGKGKKVAKGTGKLTKIGDNTWESAAGLIYGPDKKFGNRVKHVLAHGVPNPSKANHTVFNVGSDGILKLVDEAWTMKGNPLANDPGAYLVDMGRIIGTNGETKIKIIVKPGTSEIITAYPVK